jgi:simple sugar transport system ATP-binding protein
VALLQLKQVSKDFYGTQVLRNINFSLDEGEILGLVGENGAGKTTLMHILFGMPVIAETGGFDGTICINDVPALFKTPFDALDAGVGMVHQEFSLIPGFTADENIVLNREPCKHGIASMIFGERLGTLKRDEIRDRSVQAIDKLGVKIEPDTPVSEMPVGHKQFTEIAREINRDQVRLLVMDEPTAVLTETEADILLDSVKALAREGIAVIFISHRLSEITKIADRILVLRDGDVVKNTENKGVAVADIAAWMVGRTAGKPAAHSHQVKTDTENIALHVEHLWVDMPGETVRDVSFSVREGEIFGIGGLAGQGKLGIPNGIMGLYTAGGTLRFNGQSLSIGNLKAVLDAGLAFVSEDRRGVGLLLDESLDWNIAFGVMQTSGGCLKKRLGGLFSQRDEKAMEELAEEYIKALEIKCTGPKQKAKELSGGNQQKICLAKAFALNPKLLFVSEPTRGIDIGAKKIVLDTLRRYNQERGTTIVMISSELEELRSICERIAIVVEGRIAGILPPETETAEFGLLMSGETLP